MIGSLGVAGEPSSRALVGAIRWDAWTGGEVTKQVERTLGPAKYHFRLPWFAEVLADDQVRIDGGHQGIMDQEIEYASTAGLDYWAFLLYPEASSMSDSLKQYLASPLRQRIGFCLILHNAFGVADTEWPKERDRAVALLQEPGYQTVLGGRPLVYLFSLQYKGRFPAERFADFLRIAETAGLHPYCVYMGWNPVADYREHAQQGFDAVSAYAHGGAQSRFADLAQAVETRYWESAATAQVPYVPLVSTGWNKEPRKDHPVSWERNADYHRQTVFTPAATPEEIAEHLSHSLAFVRQHPTVCPANAIIIYAWNELDEGGWLVPTWTPTGKPDTTRLEAIRRILRPGSGAVP